MLSTTMSNLISICATHNLMSNKAIQNICFALRCKTNRIGIDQFRGDMMTTVAILPESTGKDGPTYRAVAGNLQSVGRTAGEALDALTAQLSEEESGTLIIVQNQ